MMAPNTTLPSVSFAFVAFVRMSSPRVCRGADAEGSRATARAGTADPSQSWEPKKRVSDRRGADRSRGSSDDGLGLEVLKLARRHAEPLGVDLVIVLAEQRRAVDGDARLGHLHRPAGQGELAALGMVDGHDHLPLLERGILRDLHRVVDGPGGDPGVAQGLHHLELGAALGELVEDAVHLVVVGPAPLRRAEALVADQILPADGFQEPVPVAVTRTGGVDEAVVVEPAALALVEAAGGGRAEGTAV